MLHKTLLFFGFNSCCDAVDLAPGDGRREQQSKSGRNGGCAVNRCGESSTVVAGDATGLLDSLSPFRIAVMRAGAKIRYAHHDPQRIGCKPES